MSSHSPGPWQVGTSILDGAFQILRFDPKGVPAIVARAGYLPNARLIAAAPDLLKAAHAGAHLCRSLLAMRDGATDELLAEIRDALDAAIRDAEGPPAMNRASGQVSPAGETPQAE